MVISLDFELMWGVLDHVNPMDYKENIKNVWKVVPLLLEIFSRYGIHATWGGVGLMAEKDIKDCRKNMPHILPSYDDKKYSAYSYFDFLEKIDERYLFAGDLLTEIKGMDGQEIGSHTYSHYYCMEKGQTREQFEADLLKAKESLNKYNAKVKSILLPRNQFNEMYAMSIKRAGIENYRGNESSFFYKARNRKGYRNVLCRACRLLDSYLPFFGNHCYRYDEVKDSYGLNNVKSSRFLRPYTKRSEVFEPLRMKRIKGQMKYAAKNGLIFHLWWHPHNFGKDIEKNKKNLFNLLDHFSKLSEQYGFKSLNMEEVGNIVNGI